MKRLIATVALVLAPLTASAQIFVPQYVVHEYCSPVFYLMDPSAFSDNTVVNWVNEQYARPTVAPGSSKYIVLTTQTINRGEESHVTMFRACVTEYLPLAK